VIARIRVRCSEQAKISPRHRWLRAIAVLAVVAYHTGVPGFVGGFTGVDVFFVISGYLITGLLLPDIERFGRVRILEFYARPVRRILPPLVLVVLATAIASFSFCHQYLVKYKGSWAAEIDGPRCVR
jgi:peptidoglycan/LPS O-acetylase OafA/YrhL